jgi:hypothetical protein
MIGHRGIKKNLLAYLEGDLSGRERERIKKHLAACPSCQGEVESLTRLRSRLERQTIPMPDPEVWRALPERVRSAVARERSRLEASKVPSKAGRWGSLWPFFSPALALLLLAVGLFWMKGSVDRRGEWERFRDDPDRLVSELARVDPALLQTALAGKNGSETGWMEAALEIVDSEQIEEEIWWTPELFNELLEEEEI